MRVRRISRILRGLEWPLGPARPDVMRDVEGAQWRAHGSASVGCGPSCPDSSWERLSSDSGTLDARLHRSVLLARAACRRVARRASGTRNVPRAAPTRAPNEKSSQAALSPASVESFVTRRPRGPTPDDAAKRAPGRAPSSPPSRNTLATVCGSAFCRLFSGRNPPSGENPQLAFLAAWHGRCSISGEQRDARQAAASVPRPTRPRPRRRYDEQGCLEGQLDAVEG
jgi:hypothetical protein